jgi:hypothetical protein
MGTVRVEVLAPAPAVLFAEHAADHVLLRALLLVGAHDPLADVLRVGRGLDLVGGVGDRHVLDPELAQLLGELVEGGLEVAPFHRRRLLLEDLDGRGEVSV